MIFFGQVALDKYEGCVKHKFDRTHLVRCMSTANFASMVEDQSCCISRTSFFGGWLRSR